MMPSDVSEALSVFDRFATKASDFVSRAWFFVVCVLLVLLWAPSFFLLRDLDTWQLIINTLTTIVTFLLVALLQNTQKRADQATQHKLNAIATENSLSETALDPFNPSTGVFEEGRSRSSALCAAGVRSRTTWASRRCAQVVRPTTHTMPQRIARHMGVVPYRIPD